MGYLSSNSERVNEIRDKLRKCEEYVDRAFGIYNSKAKLIGAPQVMLPMIELDEIGTVMAIGIDGDYHLDSAILYIPDVVEKLLFKVTYSNRELRYIKHIKLIGGKGIKTLDDAFDNNTFVESVDISELNLSKITSAVGTFRNCSSLVSVNLGKFNPVKCTDIKGMFSNCLKLTSVDLSHFDFRRCNTVENLFYNCISLTDIKIDWSTFTNITRMSFMMCGCRSIKHLDLRQIDISSLKEIDYTFYGCEALKSIEFGKAVNNHCRSFNNTFERCTSLEKLDLSGFNVYVTHISGIVAGCINLKEVLMPNIRLDYSYQYRVLAYNLFLGSNALEYVDISGIRPITEDQRKITKNVTLEVAGTLKKIKIAREFYDIVSNKIPETVEIEIV